MSLSILTLGYGSFAGVNFIPTLGYIPSEETEDTHDGFWDIEDDTPKRLEAFRRRKEELREEIQNAFEEVTGESKVPTLSQVHKEALKATPKEKIVLMRVREDLTELRELEEKLRLFLEQEDVIFIASILC